ncbi:hypothetical protein PF002_g31169 [Phytophthora fragariae]|uniref:Secreted protein n=1 Tax=Phytophthora fragariae TaxID=53985 RepID=A0A6A3VEU3_9STRA|nr:hypothetical protein PF002_g31169 [Phytophthora fragariae]
MSCKAWLVCRACCCLFWGEFVRASAVGLVVKYCDSRPKLHFRAYWPNRTSNPRPARIGQNCCVWYSVPCLDLASGTVYHFGGLLWSGRHSLDCVAHP